MEDMRGRTREIKNYTFIMFPKILLIKSFIDRVHNLNELPVTDILYSLGDIP
jgi:hypothetical protein